LGNINIISKYIDDTELVTIFSNEYFRKNIVCDTILEEYDLLDDNTDDTLLDYKDKFIQSDRNLQANIHDILLYYTDDYDSNNIEHLLEFNERKKTLDIWLQLTIMHYNNLICFLEANFKCRTSITANSTTYM
jgi:hypothetical protein